MNITGTCKDIYKGINGDLVKGMLERDIKMIRDALEAGADPNVKVNTCYCNILAWACSFISQEESTEAIRLLLEHGADIRQAEKDPRNLPLNIAVSKNNTEAARMLIEAGADLNAADHMGNTPLEIAAAYDYSIITELLVKAGADTAVQNSRGMCPFIVAVHNSSPKSAQILAAATPDIKEMVSTFEKTREGNFLPLVAIAARNMCPKTMKIILEYGLDPENRQERLDISLLEISKTYVRSRGVEETMKMLIDAGADVNAAFPNRDTPLQSAVSNNREGAVRLLIDAGADVNFTGTSSQPPLQIAVERWCLEITGMLLERGADPNAIGPGGYPPLCTAIKTKATKAVPLLLKSGADPNRADRNLRTPLNWAAGIPLIGLMRMLIKAGGDLYIKNSAGRDALEVMEYYRSDKYREYKNELKELQLKSLGKRLLHEDSRVSSKTNFEFDI